jgi:hypothetical protein
MDDGTSTVRDVAYVCFGTLVKMLGERTLQGYLNKLDKIKLAKVKEIYGGFFVSLFFSFCVFVVTFFIFFYLR